MSRSATLPAAAVDRLLDEHYALGGRLEALPGYHDRNLLLTTGSGNRFVVKISQGGRLLSDLAVEHRAMARASAAGLPVPTVIDNRDGAGVTRVDRRDTAYLLRVLTFLPGTRYADVPAENHTPALWTDFGALLGKLDRVLYGLPPPDNGASAPWDLAHGYAVCRNAWHALDGEPRRLVGGFLEHYRRSVRPCLGELPRSVIHNDANDYNVLVDDAVRPTRIVGLIDFGDLMLTHTVNELAIAAAYALMRQPNPARTLRYLVESYHEVRSLTGAEVSAVVGLIGLRLCMTVCHAAVARTTHADDAYRQVSAKPAIELLARLREELPR